MSSNPFENTTKKTSSAVANIDQSGGGSILSGKAGTMAHIIGELVIIGGVYYVLNGKINALDERIIILEKQSGVGKGVGDNSSNLEQRLTVVENALKEVGNLFDDYNKEIDQLYTANNALKNEILQLKQRTSTTQRPGISQVPQVPPRSAMKQPPSIPQSDPEQQQPTSIEPFKNMAPTDPVDRPLKTPGDTTITESDKKILQKMAKKNRTQGIGETIGNSEKKS